jgi:hypothetical protein
VLLVLAVLHVQAGITFMPKAHADEDFTHLAFPRSPVGPQPGRHRLAFTAAKHTIISKLPTSTTFRRMTPAGACEHDKGPYVGGDRLACRSCLIVITAVHARSQASK